MHSSKTSSTRTWSMARPSKRANTFDDSKSPKTIDFDIKKGNDEGKKQVGIFKIEEDKVTMVLGMPGEKDRPTSFTVEAGSNVVEVVLKREKQ